MGALPGHIGRYEVRDRLGWGGMGVVYLGFDPVLRRSVAIKVFLVSSGESGQRVLREARLAARVQHPHIVTIYDVGEHEGNPYLAMELIAGRTMAQIIRDGEQVPLERKVQWLSELCAGLNHAHEHGIVHGDLKPSNIMIEGSGRLRLMDVGIARVTESSDMTGAGMIAGTPRYMSPEQVTGQPVDARSDIFSLGAVAYELLTGRQAFEGDQLHQVLQMVVDEQPRPLENLVPDAPAALIRTISRCLQKDPAMRPENARVLEHEFLSIARRLDSDEHTLLVLPSPKPAAAPTAAAQTRRPPAEAFRAGGSHEVPGGRIDRVHLSLVAPPDVRPGEAFVVAVWAHLESQRPLVLKRALEASGRPVAIHTKGPARVAQGTILTVRVRLTGAVIEPTEDTILWEGEIGAALFSARVPDGALERSCDGIATVFAHGVQIARIAFTIRVSTSQPVASSFLGRTVPHRTAFASYAREDLNEVGARIQGMQKVIPDLDVFWDVLSLRSGQRWEHELSTVVPSRDVFFLFWSKAASRSRWVEREWRCALEARGIDYIDPIPLVSPDVVPPPSELATLHFGDRLLPFTARPSAPIVDTTYRILKSSVTRIFRLWSGSSNPE